jgi:hypothetical protein
VAIMGVILERIKYCVPGIPDQWPQTVGALVRGNVVAPGRGAPGAWAGLCLNFRHTDPQKVIRRELGVR